MKKISIETYNKLLVENSKRGEQHPIIKELMTLNVGETVQIEENEWKRKTPLSVYIGNYKIRMGMSFSIRKVGKEGWIIKKLA